MDPGEDGAPLEVPELALGKEKTVEGEQGLTVRLPTKTHRVLKLLVAAKGLSLNEVFETLAEEWIAQQPEHKQFEKIAENALSLENAPAPKPASKPVAKKTPASKKPTKKASRRS